MPVKEATCSSVNAEISGIFVRIGSADIPEDGAERKKIGELFNKTLADGSVFW